MKRLSLLILLYCVSLTVLTAQDCGSKYDIKLPCYYDYLSGFEDEDSLPLYPYAKRPNGCNIPGAKPGVNDAFKFKGKTIYSFRSACNYHDKCYSRLDSDPNSCNWIAGKKMQEECLSLLVDPLSPLKSGFYGQCFLEALFIQVAITGSQDYFFWKSRNEQKEYNQRVANFLKVAKTNLSVPFNGSANYWLKFTDPAKYGLEYSREKDPDHGSLEKIKSGNVLGYRYVPNNRYTGEDNFTIFLKDTKNPELSQNINVKVVVNPNNPPKAGEKTYGVRVNTFPNGPLTSILFAPPASDPDGHDISYSVVTGPSNGEITLLENKKGFRYMPNEFFGHGVPLGTISKNNTDKFTYRVTDEYGKSDIGTASFIIYAKNHLVIAQKTNTSTGTGTIKSDPVGISYPNDVTEDFTEFGYVTFTAVADEGSIFTGWDGSCTSSGSNRTCTLLINGSKRVFAKFDLEPTSVNLSVNKSGDGSGTIESDSANINCGDDCTESYSYGLASPVVLNAKADDSSVFIGWEGDCKGKEPCMLYMSQDFNVTAKFLLADPKNFQVTNLDDQGSGSLRQAIINANINPGKDTISFSNKLKGTITLDSGELSIKESLVINGPGANILSISGNDTSRLFYINPGSFESVSINGLTLEEGFDTTGNGGSGIMINSGDVNLTTLSMHHNSANGDIGGGGAIRKFGSGSLKISKSTFYSNSALTEYDEGAGGAIRIDAGRAVIVNSTLSKNTSAFGGAVAVGESATLILNNSTLSGNTATGWGAGVSNDGIFKVSNSIIAANSAPTDSDIFTSSLSSSEFLSSGYNIFGENGNSGISSDAKLAASDIILKSSIDSVIGPLKNNGGTTLTHLVVDDGPAVAAGSDDLYIGDATTTDQRGEGYYRFMKDAITIGAVEKYAPVVMPAEIQVDVNSEIKIMPLQGYPVAVSLENASLASAQIDSFGFITIKGDSVGSVTIQVEDAQGNVSKVLLDVSRSLDLGNNFNDLLWHNSSTGAIKIIQMNGMRPESNLTVVESSNLNLIPKGIGDFTGDGQPDILFHNQNSGNLRIWEMDGTSKVENIQVLGSSNTNLQIAGVGDFDGDGDTDIATFNTNSGALRMWVMEGTTRVDNISVLTGANVNLVPRGAGDMNNDGIPDIVLRNNNSGAVRVWTMNSDFTRKGNEYVTGSSNTNLELRGVMDINGDGNNDILNYNTNTGKLRAWLMDGKLKITENAAIVQDPDLDWSVRN